MRISLDSSSGEDLPLFGLDHGLFFKLALIPLLLGAVCLATPELLSRSRLGVQPDIARLAEPLGWIALMFSTAVLLLGWREYRREAQLLRGVLSYCLKRTEPWALNANSPLKADRKALCVLLPSADNKSDHVDALYMYFDPRWVEEYKFARFRSKEEREKHRQAQSRAKQIDDLYGELIPLMSRVVKDPGLQKEADAKLSLLRQLQEAEADEMERRFEAGLLIKPGEGTKALERARELLARYEDPSIKDPTPQPKN